MAIPSQPTTAISLGPTNTPTQRSISNEFGDTAPYQLDQYRRPSPLVPTNPANAPIPASPGQPISFSQFNGTTSAPGTVSVNYQVTASNNNMDLLRFATSPNRPAPTRYVAGTPGWAVTFTIANNVVIGSGDLVKGLRLGSLTTNTSSPTAWHPDVTLTINNQGAIVGTGGKGGDGASGVPATPSPGQNGYKGGTALNIQRPISIYNNPGPWARISGGGGGGGGGGGFHSPTPVPSPVRVGGCGGGGGAGIANTIGGAFGGGNFAGGAGGPATTQPTPLGVSANGAGGSRGSPQGGGGGYGGAFGAAGAVGAAGGSLATLAGSAGFYVKGDAQVTWQATGTRQGSAAPTQQAPLTTIQYQLIANTGVNLFTFATQPARPAPTLYAVNQPGKRLEFTVGPGVIIGASAVGGTGIVTGGTNEAQNFHPDVEIVIINQGYIVGGAGPAGNGRPAQPGLAGAAGGTAVAVSYAGQLLTVQNQGEIRAGGGGGGASGGYPAPTAPVPLRFGAGGGAGAGQVGPGRGTGQPGAPASQGQPSSPGQPAPIIASPGQGGTAQHPVAPVTGGAGGNWGQPGQSGQPAPPGGLTGGAGGPPGYYGQGAIIWQELGTVQGLAPTSPLGV